MLMSRISFELYLMKIVNTIVKFFQMIQTVEGEVLSESNLLQTLQQHGLALSADDLHTLRNFIKPTEVGDNQHQLINQQVIYFSDWKELVS